MDVVVAGAGPAGLSAAAKLKDVGAVIVEAMPRLGYPPHCTGIVSAWTATRLASRSLRALAAEGLLEAMYREAVFLDGMLREHCRIEGAPLAVKLARPGLEEFLAAEAEAQGHRLLLRHRLLALKQDRHKVMVVVEGAMVKRLLVERALLATGAQATRPGSQRGCWRITGLEERVRLSRRIEDEAFLTIHGTRLAPGFFAWVAPLAGGREAVIGLASSQPRLLAENLSALRRLLERRGFIAVTSVTERRGGAVLRGPPAPRASHGRVAGLGDVLCASKPYTGGGLYAIAALSEPAARWLEKGDGGYEEAWRRLSRELLLQHVLTHAAARQPAAFMSLLRAACSRAGRGGCRIDFDRHSSLLRCLMPRSPSTSRFRGIDAPRRA